MLELGRQIRYDTILPGSVPEGTGGPEKGLWTPAEAEVSAIRNDENKKKKTTPKSKIVETHRMQNFRSDLSSNLPMKSTNIR